MGAIRMLSANELRRRWFSTVAITLLVGVVGAMVIAAVAGARRSDSSLRRFNDVSRSANVEIEVGTPTAQQLRAFERAIGSPPIGLIHAYGMSPRNRTNVAMATSVDDSFGTIVDRPRVISGRLANPNAVDEATISESLAQQTGINVGRTLRTVSVTPQQIARGDFSPSGPTPTFRVVGIVRRPVDLSDLAASGGLISLTPAFDRAYAGKIALFTLDLRIRVPGGAAGAAHVVAVARRMFGTSDAFNVDNPTLENSGAQSAINVVTAALWVFAAVAAAAGLFAIGVVLFREISQRQRQYPTLRAVGLTRRSGVAAAMPRALLIAVAGASIAVVGAVALSPLLPFGIARRADPHPGVHADWLALAIGAGVGVLFVLGIAVVAAVRASRVDAERVGVQRSRSIVDALAVSRWRPTIANGVRLALDPSRDERAVPMRSAFAGAVLGVTGVAAILVFAASLSTLGGTPRLYGWTWDVKARDPSSPAHCDRKTFDVERQPGVSDVAAVCYHTFDVDGRNTVVWGFTEVHGSIQPTITAGRAPNGDREIALGLSTMHALHKHLGADVEVGRGGARRSFRIVGQAVFPPMTYGDVQHLADGATVTGDGFARVLTADDDETTRYVVARVAPADRATVIRNVRAALVRQVGDDSLAAEAVAGPTRPPEIERIRHVAWFLPTLAILVSGLALVAVAHALVMTARRRRYELAVLKAVGFTRGQVRATLAWDASTLAIVGIAVGIPAGIVVGRLTWSLVAHNIGVAPTIAMPVLAIALVVPATLALVNAVAYLPARAAATARTAAALTSE